MCKVESFHPARMKFMDKNNILFDNYYTEKKEGLNKQELKKCIFVMELYIFLRKKFRKDTIKGKKVMDF